MNLEELVTTRNKYQRRLEDKTAYRKLCDTVGKNNATAQRVARSEEHTSELQ